MTNKRTAQALKRNLDKLDMKIWSLWDKEPFDDKQAGQLEAQKKALISEAAKNGLPLISVSVADGSALYYEANRTSRLVTFEWLYGGEDVYYSDFGKTVAIPVETANNRLKSFNPKYL